MRAVDGDVLTPIELTAEAIIGSRTWFVLPAELAAEMRERSGVPVAYGEAAPRRRQTLPPGQRSTPTVSASHALPPAASASRASRFEAFKAAAAALDRLRPGSLADLARQRVDAEQWLIDLVERIDHARSDLARSRRRLDRAHARVGSNRDADRDIAVRWEVREAAVEVAMAAQVNRAIGGDATAARRVVWVLIAQRWRSAQAAYARVLKAEQDAKRRRSVRTGVKLKRSTIEQYKGLLASCRAGLDSSLRALAAVPTPTYHDWCRMFRRRQRTR